MKNSSKPIVVAHKDTGALITMREIANKQTGEVEEVGTVMVQSKSLGNLSGIGGVQTRTAFITLRQDAIDFLDGQLKAGQPFPVDGKIVIQETLVPYVKSNGETQEPKINPSTQEIITYQGQPVYRNMVFTQDLNAQDVFLREVSTGVEASEEVASEEEVVE